MTNTAQMTPAERFRLVVTPSSSNQYGWAGTVVDRLTGTRTRVLKNTSGGEFAFDTKAKMVEAAKRIARGLL